MGNVLYEEVRLRMGSAAPYAAAKHLTAKVTFIWKTVDELGLVGGKHFNSC